MTYSQYWESFHSGELEARIAEMFFREGWDKLNQEELAEVLSGLLDELVEEGKVERLIGDDGLFYYRSIKKE